MLSGEESGIGNLNYQPALTAALAAERERKLYKKYTEKERYKIGNHASENGIVTASRKYKSKFNIRESTVQSLKNKYEQMIKSAKRKNETPEKAIKEKKRGLPILLGEIDDMVQRFLLSLRKKGGLVHEVVARSVAKTLVKRSGKPELMSVDFDENGGFKVYFLAWGSLGEQQPPLRCQFRKVPRRKRSLFICTQLSPPLKNTRSLSL